MQLDAVLERDSLHCRGRDDHRADLRAAMRELATRALHPAHSSDQIEDRLLLPRQDAWTALPPGSRSSSVPVSRSRCRQRCARTSARSSTRHARGVRHPACDGLVDQPQQLELGLGAHARGDRAEKPERCCPVRRELDRSSFSDSESRSFPQGSDSTDRRAGPAAEDAAAARPAELLRRIDGRHVDALAGRVAARAVEVRVPADIAERARVPIERMVAIG